LLEEMEVGGGEVLSSGLTQLNILSCRKPYPTE
jgi:hypothetical protein